MHHQVCRDKDLDAESECVCLPPVERIGHEYSCRPAPEQKPSHTPVFGENYLMHYFRNPQCLDATQTKIYNQLHKRACGRLRTSPDELALGWGVYFQEGWHWKSIYFIVVVLMVTASLVFGVAWSVLKGDLSGAFAVASAWVTLGSLFLGYIGIRSF